ncbi:hypothetical protein CDD82_975 [Ophiocordyceps australis]|uniref:Rhamnogalacturonase A/B/Epimerase-like pectate lyase domain-containing protein n=1 Tax=Ophiocordyceps australis TaxID=1399860 RepID=A0A2C5YLQ5_9HYPO|nr:hypothetical protein CDD82_975 [Ophiocordyceps australis]
MKDNVRNIGDAPDQGLMNGPVLWPRGKNPMMMMEEEEVLAEEKRARKRGHGDYWLANLSKAGKMPHAPSDYEFFRNVKDFGAVGDGKTDDTAAINRAVATHGRNALSKLRCGEDCGSSSALGALVYFPPGTYLITTPIIQYFYTQFVGHATDKPTIKGAAGFQGMALIDSDVYIPGGAGDEWYINQSNFYRQVRNLRLDLTEMNETNTDYDQVYVPAGIHWQVGQATSIANCDFVMPVAEPGKNATAVGIFMENGSGGVVSDLTFVGG